MADQLPDTNYDAPRVILAERVVNKILRGALLYPEPETGEAMVGLIAEQTGRLEPDIYVMDTISPGEQAVRHWGMFEQGSDWQADVFNWLHDNWEAFRDLRRSSYGSAIAAKWDLPLMHVGDWHKQPGDMTEPSAGDDQTARAMINDIETPLQHIVAPIVTMYSLKPPRPMLRPAAEVIEVEETPTENGDTLEEAETAAEQAEAIEEVETILTPEEMLKNPPPSAIVRKLDEEGWIVRVDFWYMSKRNKRFVSVNPVIWPDDRLPALPPVAWHLQHPKRFDQEYDLLTQAGYAVDVVRWDADGRPPYEICFSVYKPGSQRVIVLVTPVDYPVQMPAMRIAPLVSVAEDEDVFEKVYGASKPVLATQMPEWRWDSKRTLIELVWHLEKTVSEDTKL
jgi:hypothetical protein